MFSKERKKEKSEKVNNRLWQKSVRDMFLAQVITVEM